MKAAFAIAMMTLGNMRSLGVRSLAVRCLRCHRDVVFDAEAYSDDVLVPAFAPRLVCSTFGAFDADARPHWNERAPPNLFGGNRL